MERRSFLGGALAGSALFGKGKGFLGVKEASAKQSDHMIFADNVFIERDEPGQQQHREPS